MQWSVGGRAWRAGGSHARRSVCAGGCMQIRRWPPRPSNRRRHVASNPSTACRPANSISWCRRSTTKPRRAGWRYCRAKAHRPIACAAISPPRVKRETTISWVWDVFDRDDRRALRIASEETAKGGTTMPGPPPTTDAAPDRQQRMERLAAFLTSPEVRPARPTANTRMASARASSPEAAGIFRISAAGMPPAPRSRGQPPAMRRAGPADGRRSAEAEPAEPGTTGPSPVQCQPCNLVSSPV